MVNNPEQETKPIKILLKTKGLKRSACIHKSIIDL